VAGSLKVTQVSGLSRLCNLCVKTPLTSIRSITCITQKIKWNNILNPNRVSRPDASATVYNLGLAPMCLFIYNGYRTKVNKK